MSEETTAEEAVARMWAYLDGHPIRAAFPDPVRWTTFRYGQRGIVEGTDTGVWWSDRRARRDGDGRITSWADRAELWSQAVDAYGEELGRPDRRPNERVPAIRDLLFRVIIPRKFDPFRQRVSDEAEPFAGTEHDAVASKRKSGVEDENDPGRARVQHGRAGTGMASISAVLPRSYPPAAIEAWAVRNAGRAAAAEAAALREVGCDPVRVAAGDEEMPSGARGAQYRAARTRLLVEAMNAAADQVGAAEVGA